MFDKEAIQEPTKAQAITAAANAVGIQADAIVALPNDFSVHDFGKYLGRRRRARGVMNTPNVIDFARYVTGNKEIGAVVFI